MATERVAELKDRLKEVLDKKGLRAVDLMEMTGVPKSAISFYLAGKSKPKADRIYTIARALDISEAWLLGYDVPMARSLESKKNDVLSKLVVRLRNDDKLYNLVVALAEADADKLDLIDKLVSSLTK
jgi:transcriptional regulator with XRE-family HTH domain